MWPIPKTSIPKTDNQPLTTAAIAAAVAACGSGGEVVLPGPGVYVSDVVTLTSDNLTLRIAPGAVLRARLSMANWPTGSTFPDHGLNDTAKPQYRPFIFATGQRHLRLLGGGTIDAAGHAWWVAHCNGSSSRGGRGQLQAALPQRPFVVRMDQCDDVLVADLTIINPPFWTLVPTDCTKVRIHNVSIAAPTWSPNTGESAFPI